MIPKLVTFDCAETLIGLPEGWTLGTLAVDSARSIGLEPVDGASIEYLRIYASRLPEFWALNQKRDMDAIKQFWRELAISWLQKVHLPEDVLDNLLGVSDNLLFGPKSNIFRVFDDVVPCLDQLDELGVKAAVISNWDYSLHRVLKMFDLYDRFLFVTASLEVGVEKPDPRIFQLALEGHGLSAADVFHVGDSHEDDVVGAQNAGIRFARIDRGSSESSRDIIRSLVDLPEAFAWRD